MPSPSEQELVGLDYLDAVTTLLQRVRSAHPTAGLKEAADLQWSWRDRRTTDGFPQLFWFDDDGQPEAAVIATALGEQLGLDLIVMPDATTDRVAKVIERGLAHVAGLEFGAIELEVDRDDDVLRRLLTDHGFALEADGVVEAWLAADARPEISALADGYRLSTRLETTDRPHHMINADRNHTDPEPRLRETSLYRPDLDLVVFDRRDEVAAYGLFWYDPVNATGLVEPMRTENDHQRRGLARHVLTSGLDLLAEAGADRIKLVYEPDNPGASLLYLSVGFVPDRQTDIFRRTAGVAPATS